MHREGVKEGLAPPQQHPAEAAAPTDEVGGQTMALGASLQSLMQHLAAALGISFAEHVQQGRLPGPQGRHVQIGGMGAVSHGRDARCATC